MGAPALITEKETRRLSRLFATPWTVAYQASWSMGFSRQEYWSGLPCPSPGDLPYPGIEPEFPALEADTLTSEPPGKPGRYPNSWLHQQPPHMLCCCTEGVQGSSFTSIRLDASTSARGPSEELWPEPRMTSPRPTQEQWLSWEPEWSKCSKEGLCQDNAELLRCFSPRWELC